MGRLAGLVIDEAHLVTQWGRSFRPEFRTLGRLRSELLAAAAGTERRAPLTLLLSATMSSRCIEDLQGPVRRTRPLRADRGELPTARAGVLGRGRG